MIDWLFQNTPLYLMTQSFWTDEGFSYLIARLPFPLMLERAAADFNPPLYYVFLHIWMKLFGSSEVIIRSLSLLFFMASAYVFYLFLTRILNASVKRKWLYMILFVGNPFLLYYAFEARMYALFAFCSMAAYYLFIKKNYKWYSLAVLLGLYTHYFFVFVIATHLIYTYFYERIHLRKVLSSIMIPFLFFLPWLIYSIPLIMPHLGNTWIHAMTMPGLFTIFGTLYTGYEPDFWHYYDSYIGVVSVMVIAAGLWAVIKLRKMHKQDKLLALLVLWTFLFYSMVAVISFWKPIFVPRYLMFAPLGLLVLFPYILESMSQKYAAFVGVVLIFFMLHFHYLHIQNKRKGDVRRVVRQIKMLSDSHDVIYVTDPTLYFPAAYYFDEQRVYVYTRVEEVPYYIGLSMIPKEKIRLDLPLFPSKAFIINEHGDYKVLTVL